VTAARARLTAEHLDAFEVADLLELGVPEVNWLFIRGDLAGAERDGKVAYPRSQFTDDDHRLPGLHTVLAAFPASYGALDVQTVMTSPMEELDGKSPREWLNDKLPIDRVVELLCELTLT